MTRLTPIPEYLNLSANASDAARRAWDPYHRDAFAERQFKIRGCLDLVAVLNTVPDFYRGVISSIGSDINVMLDELDTVTRRKSKYEVLKADKKVPYQYASLKLPTVQHTKRANPLYKEHFTLPANDLLVETQKKMMDM
jgi:hypothetical protein